MRLQRRPDAPEAVDRLRDALAYNGLTFDGDEHLLAGVLAGRVVSNVELAEAICSARRKGLPEAPIAPPDVQLSQGISVLLAKL